MLTPGLGSSVNSPVVTVTATDADTLYYGNIKYSLVGDSTALNFFKINSGTGVVSLSADITAQEDAVYRYAFRLHTH